MSEQQIPSRLVFRIPGVANLGALLIAVCAVPVAFAAPWLPVIFLAPVAIVVWIVRVRTTADATGLVARTVFRSRAMPWESLKGLRLTKGAGVHAVLTDDTEVALPSVRVRHLPALALVSGGRLDDPTASAEQETEPATEPTAEPATETATETPTETASETDASKDGEESARTAE